VEASLNMFAYLAAFVTVVLSLAIGDLVQSVHRLLRARLRVQWSLMALFAAATVFLAILEEFFALWRLAGIERFTYYELLTLILPPIVLSLAAMAVLPDEIPPEGLDLGDYYMSHRRLVFLLLALWVLGIFVRLSGLVEALSGRSAAPVEIFTAFPWQTLPLLAILALLAWSDNRKLQVAGLVVILVLVNSAMSRRAIEAPTAHPTILDPY
jgi:hypothetical protein